VRHLTSGFRRERNAPTYSTSLSSTSTPEVLRYSASSLLSSLSSTPATSAESTYWPSLRRNAALSGKSFASRCPIRCSEPSLAILARYARSCREHLKEHPKHDVEIVERKIEAPAPKGKDSKPAKSAKKPAKKAKAKHAPKAEAPKEAAA